ncbi:adenylate/guanylate cyclase domain-containing protein [Leptolyngbya sp. AN02str]|uniref:adenylate/guanylate cyclase domain-containing protein n=1 Tax=Leptolyngbya sp. AN02str TaxID=3423363 RepID=UPI003D312584
MMHEQGAVLVVDDNEMNRDLLSRRLQRQGHQIVTADNGKDALDKMRSHTFDLVLLDIMMPEMNGYEVLEYIKQDPDLRHIPVIMISALDDIDSVVRCIELGAEDYLFKPFNPTILKARIGACLEKKRLRDQEQAYLKRLEDEQEKSEKLLLNILPWAIAEQLKQGAQTIADNFAEVTVLFADLVNFTELASHLPPTDLVKLLNEIFSTFDQLVEAHGLEKIKTIGDAYMAVGGLPTPRPDHAEAVANMALDMQRAIAELSHSPLYPFRDRPLQIRIGINTGPVGAGVIGTKKFSYDLWGDTVNIASRMEALCLPGYIQVAPNTYERLHKRYQFERRGCIDVKGKGDIETYFLLEAL